jgi:PiT family inorganic phosphate transporter
LENTLLSSAAFSLGHGMTPKVMFAAVTVYIQTSGIAQKVLPDWLDVVFR